MAGYRANGDGEARKLGSPQTVNSAIKVICDIMRRAGLAGAMQYVPELTWILFLRILDEREEREAEEAEAVGAVFTPSIVAPYRWRDWAAPDGSKRLELRFQPFGSTFKFLNGELLPHLRWFRGDGAATPRQRIIGEIVSGVERVRIDTERNFLDVLDKVHDLSERDIDPTHVFALSQVYEGLLLKMGEKNNDGGQFFTPREVVRAMVRAVDPKIGQAVYDPCAGTGGFLVEAFLHMSETLGTTATAERLETLKHSTFFGREKTDLIFPITLANLVLHGIDRPHLWLGNTLTGVEADGTLFRDTPAKFDVILTNPPFGGKEGKEAQTHFAYKTGATQVLFLQHVIDQLADGGRCGMVIEEGVLFRTSESAFKQTKRKLLDECDLWCILSLPPGVFSSAGAGVKTNLLFFTKGPTTESIWYYDLSDVKVGKRSPMTLEKFADFFRLLPDRADSDRSWTVSREVIEARSYDLKAVNPTAKAGGDTRTPEELLDFIEAKGREMTESLASLRASLTEPY